MLSPYLFFSNSPWHVLQELHKSLLKGGTNESKLCAFVLLPAEAVHQPPHSLPFPSGDTLETSDTDLTSPKPGEVL